MLMFYFREFIFTAQVVAMASIKAYKSFIRTETSLILIINFISINPNRFRVYMFFNLAIRSARGVESVSVTTSSSGWSLLAAGIKYSYLTPLFRCVASGLFLSGMSSPSSQSSISTRTKN